MSYFGNEKIYQKIPTVFNCGLQWVLGCLCATLAAGAPRKTIK